MRKPEFTTLFYPDPRSGRVNAQNHYPGRYVINVGPKHVRFYDITCRFLKLKKGDKVIFAKDEDNLYVGNVTNNSGGKRGYTLLSNASNPKTLFVNSSKLFDNGTHAGVYEIGKTPIWDESSKIDWYPITLLKLKKTRKGRIYNG